MSKALWIIIILVVIGVGSYLLFKGGYQTPAPSPAPAPLAGQETSPETPVTGEQAGEKSLPSAPKESPKAEASAIKEFTVSGDEYSFSPSSFTVSAGDKVKITFSNEGSIRHNLVIEGLGVSTASISPGQTETIEFTAPDSGIYTFLCSIPGHQAAGMEGALEVE